MYFEVKVKCNRLKNKVLHESIETLVDNYFNGLKYNYSFLCNKR